MDPSEALITSAPLGWDFPFLKKEREKIRWQRLPFDDLLVGLAFDKFISGCLNSEVMQI